MVGERGFTLLEMLVVLLLAGIITGILFQGLGQVLQLETRFGRELFNSQQGEMYTEWFRQSVNGLMPDHIEGGNRFKGSERDFSGLSLMPLEAATEALIPVAWRLRFDPKSGLTQLRYGNMDDGPVVLSWQGNSGRFIYIDGDGDAHDTWPPFLGKWPQLPRAIYLESRSSDQPAVVVAVPRGPQEPLPRRRDFEG